MNATELFHADGRSAGIYACGKCRIVAHSKSLAEQCCAPYLCTHCGNETEAKYWTVCRPCQAKQKLAKEAERFAAAEKVTEFDGPVYIDGYGGQDGYFENIVEFIDWAIEESEDDFGLPDYVWTCTIEQVVDLDLDSILEHATQEAYEDFCTSDLDGMDELEAALNKFNELNKSYLTWHANYKKALVLDDYREVIEAELQLRDKTHGDEH